MLFAIFPFHHHLSKVLRLPRKSEARSYEVLHLSRKIILANLKISWKCPTPAIVFWNARKPWRFAHFWPCAESLAPATQNHIWTFKTWSEHVVLCTFWLRNVLRATKGVCFFDISTSKHASNPSAFSTFHFQMCFAPQRRAIFRYLNFQKCSEHIRARCALYVLTSTCASRHDGVHFFDISTFKSAARLKCFVHFDSEMCSRHKGVHFFQHLKISTSKIAPQPSAFYTIHFQMCFAPQRHAIFRYLNFQKCSEHRAHPSTVCFVRFDFDMCFAPRRRALCRHLNFQKCSEAEVFCAFWLRNARAPQRRAPHASTEVKTGIRWTSEPGERCTWTVWLHFFQHLNFQNCSESVGF